MKPYRIVLACLAALAVQSPKAEDVLDLRDMADMFVECYGTLRGAEELASDLGAPQNAKRMEEGANGAWVAAAHLLSRNEAQAGKPIGKLRDYDEYIKNEAAPQTTRILAEAEMNLLTGKTETPILSEGIDLCNLLGPFQAEIIDQYDSQLYELTE